MKPEYICNKSAPALIFSIASDAEFIPPTPIITNDLFWN